MTVDQSDARDNIASFYGSSCANNGKDALNTLETLQMRGIYDSRPIGRARSVSRPIGHTRWERDRNALFRQLRRDPDRTQHSLKIRKEKEFTCVTIRVARSRTCAPPARKIPLVWMLRAIVWMLRATVW
eukprot:388889-Prorocentrum_minimum.AAC.1